MKAKIIAAYPGMGKTYATKKLAEEYPDIVALDSDSSFFSWEYDSDGNKLNERNIDFPQNYIDYIKSHIQHADFIFCSTHKEVRDLLNAEGIKYTIMIPGLSDESKAELRRRMVERGSSEEFVHNQMSQLDARVHEIIESEKEHPIVQLNVNEFSVFEFIRVYIL